MSQHPIPAPFVSAQQRATEALLTDISTGRLSPGEKLNEVALAARLDVSRNTLREAFVALAQLGVVARIPHCGVHVTLPDVGHVDEIYRMRLLLEPAALLWADGIDAAALQDCVDAGRAAVAAADPHAAGDANQRFHQTIIAATDSRYASEAMARLLALMRLVFIRGSAERAAFHFPYVEDNAGIAALIRQGRRQEAAAQMRAYLARAQADARALIAAA